MVNLLVGQVWADPRPPLPPIPALFNAQFDRPNDPDGAFHAEGIQWVESWSGYAIQLNSGFIGWAGASRMFLRQPIVSPSKGTVRFWFRPSTATPLTESTLAPSIPLSPPLVESTLLECATWAGGRAYPWFSIKTSTAGIGVVSGGRIIMGAPTNWDPTAWHFIAFTYSTTTNGSTLYLDGQPVAQGPSLAPPSIPTGASFGICFGSADGSSPAQGIYDELMTDNFVESADEIAHHYSWTAPIAALGPITPEELAARAEMRAEALAARQQRLRMQALSPMPMDDPQPIIDCSSSSGPLHLTNFVQVSSNVFQMTLAGGAPNTAYDVFRTISLNGYLTNSQWGWIGRGLQCDTITDTNAIADKGFYVAAITNGPPGSSYSYAWLALVKTNPTATIIYPANNSTFSAPTNITITVALTNYIGGSPITFYVNGQTIATLTGASGAPSCSVSWDAYPGSFEFRASVFDGVFTRTSAVVHVTITLPELASLKCWLKPEALTNSATVTNWLDSSCYTNAAVASASRAPRFVTNQLSGFPGVKFEITNNSYLAIPNFLGGATQAEAFVVLKPGALALWTFSPDQEGTYYGPTSAFDAFGRTSAVSFADPSIAGFHILNVSIRPGESVYRINGRTVYADAGTPVNFGQGAWQYLGYNNRFYGTPTIVEVLLYTNVLAECERVVVGQYLNSKYKLLTNSVPLPTLRCQGPDPRTIVVSWDVVSNATVYVLSRDGLTLTNTDTRTTSFVDPIISSQPITYTLTALGYAGKTSVSLYTPFMDFTSPAPESTALIGNVLSVSLAPAGIPGFGSFTPARIDIFINGNACTSLTGSPWSTSLSSGAPDRWNITAKVYDAVGNTRFLPGAGMNIIVDIDSDGDGVPDGQDAYPYDPLRSTASSPNPNDHTPPTIILTEP
jgi:hypothetical protein